MTSDKRHRSGHSPAAAAVKRKRVRLRLGDDFGQALIQRNGQDSEQEQSTMDSDETRTLHPREVLRQVANSMNWQYNELSVTLPAHTTWRAAIRAAETALGNIDKPMLLMPRGTGNRRLLREMASQSALKSPSENPLGLPIRTSIDLKAVEPRPPLSEAAHERLRKMAKEAANTEFRDPYLLLRSNLGEGYLPIIHADLVLQNVDSNESDPMCNLKGIDIIFDTGAHQTVIAEDLLSTSF
ncbi:uracil DNA glycosylase [Aspergillus hancockii]|nr:uracil DNA glycosylase [Aspergillus hancockii]